jgi:hypothetical protein
MSAARTVLALEFVCNISQCQAELIIVLIANYTSIIDETLITVSRWLLFYFWYI